jgi:hypothetical protein
MGLERETTLRQNCQECDDKRDDKRDVKPDDKHDDNRNNKHDNKRHDTTTNTMKKNSTTHDNKDD